MKIAINSLHWDNLDPRISEGHKRVYRYFDIPVSYTFANIPHGRWMDLVCERSNADIYVFCDADCIPLRREIFDEGIDYCLKVGSFIGPAQASNHWPAPISSHIFAAPSFFMMTRDIYEKMGRPSFVPISGRSDVAQEMSRIADETGIEYMCWYPTKYERGYRTSNPLMYDKLSNYGRYGIGTVYAQDKLYHLYECRDGQNAKLFERRCGEVISGTFSTKSMLSCTAPYAR